MGHCQIMLKIETSEVWNQPTLGMVEGMLSSEYTKGSNGDGVIFFYEKVVKSVKKYAVK